MMNNYVATIGGGNVTTGGLVDIGVREFRDGLSRHLAEVREGRTITITDHGRPVAQLVPIQTETVLQRLIAEGKVTPGRRRKRRAPAPIKTAGPVSDLIDEQRR
jgi:prevent-host-death family protein